VTTAAQAQLERPVRLETAAKKVAALRGDEGRDGGWIYSAAGVPLCQGWRTYGRRLQAAGIIGEEGGKYHVSILFLSERELAAAEAQS